MRRLFLFISLLLCGHILHAQPGISAGLQTDTLKIRSGALAVDLVKYRASKPGLEMLVIHDNENTGLEAGIEYIKTFGGSVTDSQYGGLRNFNFSSTGGPVEIDPNAIYTRQGIYAGLNKYHGWNSEASDILFSTGTQILYFYAAEPKNYIVTLHNNTDNAFTIWSYLEGGPLQSVADSVYINFEMDEDDFLIVTQAAHFNYLKQKNVNVVLQSSEALDDGSLSIYAMYRGIPYINVEVQHGHQEEQYRLIRLVADMLLPGELLFQKNVSN